MYLIRSFAVGILVATCCGSAAFGQILINEFVIDERTAGSAQVHPSTREFVELYNAGQSAVNISNWTLKTIQLGSNFGLPAGTTTYTIPASSTIAPGDYFVIGHNGGLNVDFAPPPLLSGDLFPDGNASSSTNGNFVFEIRNADNVLQDAVAVETFRDPERANLTPEQVAFTGGGIWPQLISTNVPSPNTVASMARYRDGSTTKANGRDFGYLPSTPGTTNNLPLVASHTVPDVDDLPVETDLGSTYYSSFILPRVVDPTVNDGIVNRKATAPLPAPLTGGKAIMAYDESGGGNSSHSRELTNKFDIYAYIDTDDLGVNGNEATVYGIGTTDPFFGTPNSSGLLTSTSTANGSTGVGWVISRARRDFGSGVETRTKLQLVNMDDGGDSIPADKEWIIIAEFDLTQEDSAWHRLGVSYDPNTKTVTGQFNAQTFSFSYPGLVGDYNKNGTVDAADYVVWRDEGGTPQQYTDWKANFGASVPSNVDLIGNFYVGYREALTANFTNARPPTFAQYVAAQGGGQGILAVVPEPNSIAIVVCGLLFAGNLRRRS